MIGKTYFYLYAFLYNFIANNVSFASYKICKYYNFLAYKKLHFTVKKMLYYFFILKCKKKREK